MKKAALFIFSFVFLGLIPACGSSGGSSGSKAGITVYADGKEVKSLRLYSKQTVQLKAVLKDVKGNIISDPATAWTTDWDGLGNFSDPDKSETSFAAFEGPTVKDNYIIVDCHGLKKKLKVSVTNLSISIEGLDASTPMQSGSSRDIKANVLYNGKPYEGDIVWGTNPAEALSKKGAKFEPGVTKHGQNTKFTAPIIPPKTSYLMTITVKANGFTVESDKLTVKGVNIIPPPPVVES